LKYNYFDTHFKSYYFFALLTSCIAGGCQQLQIAIIGEMTLKNILHGFILITGNAKMRVCLSNGKSVLSGCSERNISELYNEYLVLLQK
jgi:hypothetical protein